MTKDLPLLSILIIQIQSLCVVGKAADGAAIDHCCFRLFRLKKFPLLYKEGFVKASIVSHLGIIITTGSEIFSTIA